MIFRAQQGSGLAELNAARDAQRPLIIAAGVFSFFVNLLLLTGPLYMLQVYDRVLGSRSESTLVALSVLATFMFLAMGLLDHARARVLARVGARIQNLLDQRVFRAAMQRLMVAPDDTTAQTAQRDLEAIARFWTSAALIALIDAPWTPIFLAAIFIFNPILGWISIAGGLIIVGIAILNQIYGRAPVVGATAASVRADRMADMMKAESETLQALGMTGSAFDRWARARAEAQVATMKASDTGGRFSALSRTFRMFLQSAMLGFGAALVLAGDMSGGAMIAGSILMGRALQPIEQAVSQWEIVTRARDARQRLAELLSRVPAAPPRTALPRPKALIEVQAATVAPPGGSQPVLRAISFDLKPGQALGVIGPSGAGKSSLARALIGLWRPMGGKIRLDGATLDQYDGDILGSYIGYLPQRVTLFDGTIAENIARLGHPDPQKVVAAAQAAAAHDMILRLPDGYDTRVSAIGGRLSGGQIQRIGLARALYGAPLLLILDEPNSNLDNEGSMALNMAIRAHKSAGGAVLVMAHRPAAIQECDLILVIEDGVRRAFGPRDEVLRDMVKNHTDIARAGTAGGVA